MTIFLVILTLFFFAVDFINALGAFGQKKRRLNFILSVFACYTVLIISFIGNILYSSLWIWNGPQCWLVIITLVVYFFIHACRGLKIYNCQEEPMVSKQMNNSNFEKN